MDRNHLLPLGIQTGLELARHELNCFEIDRFHPKPGLAPTTTMADRTTVVWN